MFGIVEINGKQYTERFVTFTAKQSISNTNLVTGQVTLPGTAMFWLKKLTRGVIKANALVTNGSCPFLFKLGNSDGSTWYSAAGVGGTTDLVLDTLLFGTGQFPFVITPHLVYSDTGSIQYQVQDLSTQTYDIYFGFHGSFLIPV